MSLFVNLNLDGWILKVERYFTLNRLMNEEKLEAGVMAFEETLCFGIDGKIENVLFKMAACKSIVGSLLNHQQQCGTSPMKWF